MFVKKVKYHFCIVLLFICFILCGTKVNAYNGGLTISVPIEKSRINLDSSLFASKSVIGKQKYDLRSDVRIQVKNQGRSASCWTFSTLSVLETHLGITNQEYYDFSERHMNYVTSRTFLDGINTNGHNRELDDGGNSIIGLSYMTSGRGPILEEDMPFSNTESKINLSEIEGKNVVKKVEDYKIFPTIVKEKQTDGSIKYRGFNQGEIYTEAEANKVRQSIKEHILNYGAVTCAVVYGAAYDEYYNYNDDYSSYYCDDTNVALNHQVAIIGWDDNYSVDNFNSAHRPSKPGAYLVLNSFGKSTEFKNGCYYVSYEDAYVESSVVGVTKTNNIDYDHIYQYDPLGISTNLVLGDASTLYGANVFTRDNTKKEKLTEVSIMCLESVNCEVYVNSTDDQLDYSKFKKAKSSMTKLKPGYTTIKLDEPIELTGNKFVVAVKYASTNGKVYIGIEAPCDVQYYNTAIANIGESFISTDFTTWYDTNGEGGIKNSNICIKAFTEEIHNDIMTKKYKIDEKNNISKISPNTILKQFINNMATVQTINVYKAGDVKLTDTEYVGTGMKFTSNDNKEYTLIVKGDLNGDGEVDISDVALMKMHMIGLSTINDYRLEAADINMDGQKAELNDYSDILDVLFKLKEI